MKKGDKVWIIREFGNGRSKTAATLHSVSPKRCKIRIEGQGISSFIFNRNVPDSYPLYESTTVARLGKRQPYRLEIRE